MVCAKTVDLLSRFAPERARSPLVPLGMEANAGGRLQIEISPAEIHSLLDAGTGVIEEHQERAVPRGVPALRRQGREERLNVLALEKARLRRRHPFHRDRANTPGHSQQLRRRPPRYSKNVCKQASR
jgi:hypothetical protein